MLDTITVRIGTDDGYLEVTFARPQAEALRDRLDALLALNTEADPDADSRCWLPELDVDPEARFGLPD